MWFRANSCRFNFWILSVRSMHPKFLLTSSTLLVGVALQDHSWSIYIYTRTSFPLGVQRGRIQILANAWNKQANIARAPKEQHIDFWNSFSRWWNVLALIYSCERLFCSGRQTLFVLAYSTWSGDCKKLILMYWNFLRSCSSITDSMWTITDRKEHTSIENKICCLKNGMCRTYLQCQRHTKPWIITPHQHRLSCAGHENKRLSAEQKGRGLTDTWFLLLLYW